MNQQLTDLIAKATAKKDFQMAAAIINDKQVIVKVIHQTRRTTPRATQQPSLMWKVNGKRISAKDLMELF
jgi:hypothetical protein